MQIHCKAEKKLAVRSHAHIIEKTGGGGESGIMNHGCKISRNQEFSRLKLGNHESREIVKRIMDHEIFKYSVDIRDRCLL